MLQIHTEVHTIIVML